MHVNMGWLGIEEYGHAAYRRSDIRRTHIADILDAALSAPRPRLLLDDTHDHPLGALGAEVKAVGARR